MRAYRGLGGYVSVLLLLHVTYGMEMAVSRCDA